MELLKKWLEILFWVIVGVGWAVIFFQLLSLINAATAYLKFKTIPSENHVYLKGTLPIEIRQEVKHWTEK